MSDHLADVIVGGLIVVVMVGTIDAIVYRIHRRVSRHGDAPEVSP